MWRLTSHWYHRHHTWLTFYLLPLACLYRAIVAFRRFLYRKKILKSFSFSVPVIVVGNITVGGTGKTPFVIWLTQYLQSQGLRPGIVSRGIGGHQQKKPRYVTANSAANEVGDEALLLQKRTRCPLVIGIDRVAAINELLAHTDCNVVISDDGLQHYRMQRHVEIVMIDGARGFGNQAFLPAGPLRESVNRLQEVDVAIWQQSPEKGKLTMQLQGNQAVALKTSLHRPLNEFKKVHAVAAIGNPKRFFDSLRGQGIEIIEHVFADHYLFQAQDFSFEDTLPILMTEKDAVKCQAFADERFWFVPVDAVVDDEVGKRLISLISSFN